MNNVAAMTAQMVERIKKEIEELEQQTISAGPGMEIGTGTGDAELLPGQTGTYLVQDGDNLWGIAGKPEVYNDPYRWLLLYHANRDQIFEPDLIYPGMILLVPHYPGLELSARETEAKQPSETTQSPEEETATRQEE